MHCGYIVEVKELKPHSNADKLQIATFFGNDTCVGLNVQIGDKGIYFPSDLQLSEEFCENNHLCRKRKDGSPDTGYMDPNKRNVQAIRLRGEKSDGLFLHLSCLEYTKANLNDLKQGDRISVLNGYEICRKYIPTKPSVSNNNVKKGNKVRKKKVAIAPLFLEHADTEQLAYNLDVFNPGDQIEMTLKMHGTSQRTGYLPVFKGYQRTLLDRILHREGTPIYDWGYVSGTRRTILENYDGGYYGDNSFREEHSKVFEEKLWKGETVYYEVVGYTKNGNTIMGKANNKKLNDKEFVKKYGNETIFSYGCEPGESDMYVYRMTMTNEDGQEVEYTPEFMRYRCEQMGVKTVPVLWKGIIPENPASKTDDTIDHGEWVKNVAECFYEGPDPIGKIHIREGVVVRIVNRPKFTAYKHKNFEFKVLENIIKINADAPDMEEAESV